MTKENFDFLVIGSGPAGEKAALEAAELGAKVAVVEKNEKLGGASVLTGTIPSKSIRETVKLVLFSKRKYLSGFDFLNLSEISAEEVFHRKEIISAKLSEQIRKDFQAKHIRLFSGTAEFISEREVKVHTTSNSSPSILSAGKILIATGSSPYHPLDVPFDGEKILDSDMILTLKKMPSSMLIYGGGVIGCEYACIFAQLGVRVTLINPHRELLNFLDSDISGMLAYCMGDSGVTFKPGEQYRKIQATSSGVEISLQSGKVLFADCLLYSNGRKGNVSDLNLATAGISHNQRMQLTVDSFFRTENPDIYAAGDVIGFPSMASTGKEQGRQVARHAITGKTRKKFEDHFPLGIYTIPGVALVGKSEQELSEEGVDYEIGTCRLKELAKAMMIGSQEGMIKIIFERKSLKLLGIHIIGNSATELIHIGQAVMDFGGTLEYFVDSVFNYPTLSQGYKNAALDGMKRLHGK